MRRSPVRPFCYALDYRWYALDLAVLAVGVIERTMTGERKSFHQVAFDHLKDLQNHLEAINDIPRKIMMATLLPMDDLSLNLAHCASPWSYSESHYTCASEKTDITREEGNKSVVSFTGKLLDILHHCLPSTVSL
ncbi:hypothetical protein PRUPE_5G112400 [Prunus persica]|uniref:Uncharacterized protein n=1 Tax=Prunus persica TaxID=3760 RepID=A0A251P6U4_PRUPE|nr:uncharacterized protein LOC109949261 [Prunus persica]ONI07308.1 hypothetical protein PRUPE_5G112400 [Prunus persica]